MQITAQELAALIDGKVEGDPTISIHGPSKIEEGQPGTVSFLANQKYESEVDATDFLCNDSTPTIPKPTAPFSESTPTVATYSTEAEIDHPTSTLSKKPTATPTKEAEETSSATI